MSSKAKQVLSTINQALDVLEDDEGRKMPWFFCFGTLLEYIADRTFGLNFDIDIGAIYHHCNAEQMTRALIGAGYKVESRLLHDGDGLPLNLHFTPNCDGLVGTPSIDVYFWYRVASGLLGHTYDMNKEGTEIPKTYRFKCVDEYLLSPAREDVERIRRENRQDPEFEQVLDKNGVYHYDIWEDHSIYKFPCPMYYGTLMDEWYPGWRFRNSLRGQSKSRHVYEGVSCRKLKRV